MELFRKFTSQFLIDLRELEGDYRVSNLQSDKQHSILTLVVAAIGIFFMFRVDMLLFGNNPDLLWRMVFYRGCFVLFTALVIYAVIKTEKVRVFDRLIFGWLSVTLFVVLLFNFTRPANYLSTTFDIIVIFAVYVLSPIKLKDNIFLAISFSIGTVYIDLFLKSGVSPVALNVAVASQIIVHVLGLEAALQLQSYRRRSYKAYIEEKDAREMVAYLANIDPLTKSLTRRHFFSMAESEFQRFKRYHRPLSVLIIDADHFKNINDTHGHHAGDIVLRSLSLSAMEQKRAQDTFGRLGGEEFGLLMPETTLEQAHVVAERIQKTWEQSPVNLDGELIHSTVSIGLAEALPEDRSFDEILRRADQMLYKAKDGGRNRVVME